MKILTLQLTDFRNHNNLKIEFNEKSMLIRGPNGIGKSNILEAIHLLSTTKSLRTKYDREVIGHEANLARVKARAKVNGDVLDLEMTIAKSDKYVNSSKKIVKANKVNKSLNYFSGLLNSVLFTPTDIEILTGSPTVRRKYIDSIFFQIDKDYKKDLNNYTKAIRQRNKVLENIRDTSYGQAQLPFWDEKILEYGKNIQAKRKNLFDFVNLKVGEYENKLNSKDTRYVVHYKQNKISPARLEKYKNAEIASATTLVGPHRDDFFIEFNGFDIATFGSRGQQRTTMLALKLCEIDFITKNTGKRPILLLDDIYSELDPAHKTAIDEIVSLQQTIITTALDAKREIEFDEI